MELYAGLDLHSRNTYIGIMDFIEKAPFLRWDIRSITTTQIEKGGQCILWFASLVNLRAYNPLSVQT
jgi:hypothetical protein